MGDGGGGGGCGSCSRLVNTVVRGRHGDRILVGSVGTMSGTSVVGDYNTPVIIQQLPQRVDVSISKAVKIA